MAAFKWLKSVRQISLVDDEPAENQKQAVLNSPLFSMTPGSFSDGCEELQGAYGEFGIEISNPIPVNGPVGETIYLNRLRSKNGVWFMYHRVGSVRSPVTDNLVDHFQTISVDLVERYDFYFCMYFSRRSRKAPQSLTLKSWEKMEEHVRVMCKMDCFGTRGRVEDFPYGLPEVISRDKVLNGISPGLGEEMARRVRKILSDTL